MGIQEYVDQMRELHNLVLTFLDNIEFSQDYFEKIIKYLTENEIPKKRIQLQNFLQLLLSLSNYHHRKPGFFSKIEKILLFLKNSIKQSLSNSSIFNIFQSNKAIILFCLKSGLITLDESIFSCLIESKESNGLKICHFFISEIKNFLKDKNIQMNEEDLFEMDPDILCDYDEKRKTGENDSYICSLIRQDSVEEFISYTTRTNISLKSQIKPSIFETHSFLISENPTLIEYAAFFGSIQIVRYLYMNNVQLNSSLWFYSIHSNNPELIHFLEDNHVGPNDSNNFKECFVESIKCHHNDIANYILDNLLNPNTIKPSLFKASIQYYNYLFFPENFNQEKIFINLCKFNHLTIVKFLMLDKKDKIESTTIILNDILYDV